MRRNLSYTACIFILMLASPYVHANAPKVGRAAAAKYFQQNPTKQDADYRRNMASEGYSLSSGDRFLALGASFHTQSDAYQWGPINKEESVGKWGVDLTYRMSSYNDLLDYSIRVSYNEYEPLNQRANKMSFLYAVTFPDASSQFPLYFGAAAGPGIFFKQINNESSLSLDYQLFLGLRIFNLFESAGFYVEGGMKNHLQLTSDGQLNGTYMAAGAIFTF